MYDNTCKYLVEQFSHDFATWLLNKPISLSTLEASELTAEPIRADSVIFLQSESEILHLEFQTRPDATIPFRMLNYWSRLYRKYPNKTIRQIVIYLCETKSSLVQQTQFQEQNTSHSFQVVRLWEQPTLPFQKTLGLLPLAILTNTNNPTATLRNVAQTISSIEDRNLKSSLSIHTYILAGLRLRGNIIKEILRSDIMEESSTYRFLRRQAMEEGLAEGRRQGLTEGIAQGIAEGMAQGIAQGITEGIERGKLQTARNMLRKGMAPALIAEVTGLSLPQIEDLSKD